MHPQNGARAILVGDLNVAPLEHDVWSHKQLLRVVSHTPIECEKLNAVRDAGQWVDVMRAFVPEPAKLYTWWSYRAADWQAADRGRRLDHIWVSPSIAAARVEHGDRQAGPRLEPAVGPRAGDGDDRDVSKRQAAQGGSTCIENERRARLLWPFSRMYVLAAPRPAAPVVVIF